jgi:hypothetical protein
MFTALFAGYAVVHLGLFLRLLGASRDAAVPGGLLIAFVSAGLTYDNALIAAGSVIGPGPLLESLSWPRFALHAAFTPLLMVAAWRILGAAGRAPATRPGWGMVVGVLVVSMSAWGIGFDLVGLQIQPACLGDTLRYTTSTAGPQLCFEGQVPLPSHGPPVPSIVTVVFCIAAGLGLWRGAGWPWLAAAAVFMFAAAGAPGARLGPSIGNLGEVVLQAGLALTALRFSSGPRQGALPAG